MKDSLAMKEKGNNHYYYYYYILQLYTMQEMDHNFIDIYHIIFILYNNNKQ